MNKKLTIAGIISFTALLSSCTDSEQTTKLIITKNCSTANNICTFELVNADVVRQTNLLGKVTEKIVSSKPLQSITGDFMWNSDGAFATNTELENQSLPHCSDGTCTATESPTAYTFTGGSNNVSISGTVTIDGQQVNLDSLPNVLVETPQIADSHTFKWSETPTLPTGQEMIDVVNALNIGRDSAHGEFSVDGNSWKITCDPGYVWLVAHDPEWGSDSQPELKNGVVQVMWSYEREEWDTATYPAGDTTAIVLNGEAGGILFQAGCW